MRLARWIGISLVAVLLAISAAQAHDRVAPSGSSIAYRERTGNFSGEVVSTRTRCLRNRVVKLIKETANGSLQVGTDVSGDAGRWRILKPRAAGDYHVVVARRVYQAPGHFHKCERGASPTIMVNP